MWTTWALNNGILCHENGIVRSPGKFEGDMVYVPFFWQRSLNGVSPWKFPGGMSVRYHVYRGCLAVSVSVGAEDRIKFHPLLRYRRTVRMFEDSDGFVAEIADTTKGNT